MSKHLLDLIVGVLEYQDILHSVQPYGHPLLTRVGAAVPQTSVPGSYGLMESFLVHLRSLTLTFEVVQLVVHVPLISFVRGS